MSLKDKMEGYVAKRRKELKTNRLIGQCVNKKLSKEEIIAKLQEAGYKKPEASYLYNAYDKKPDQRVYLFIGLIVLCLVLLPFIPWGYHEEYVLRLDHLDENNCDGKVCVKSWQGDFPVLSGKAVITFEEPIDLRTVHTTVRVNASGSPVYLDGKLLWNPNWNNYTYVRSYDDVSIYALTSGFYPSADTLDGWLDTNAKGKSVYFLGGNLSNPINHVDFKPGWSTINVSLRGDHSFYVYLGDSLSMTLGKEDLNSYSGIDEINVTLLNVKTNEVMMNDVFHDDDNGSTLLRNKDPLQEKDYFLNVPRGLYLLDVKMILGENKYSDTGIGFLRINTPYIVTFGHLLPVSPVILYTYDPSPNLITFNYWHKGMDQDVLINGKKFPLTVGDMGKNVNYVTSGYSSFKFPKGDLHITGDMALAFSNNSYFSPHVYFEHIYRPDYLLEKSDKFYTDKNTFSLSAENVSITQVHITFDTSFKRTNYFYMLVVVVILFIVFPYPTVKKFLGK